MRPGTGSDELPELLEIRFDLPLVVTAAAAARQQRRGERESRCNRDEPHPDSLLDSRAYYQPRRSQ